MLVDDDRRWRAEVRDALTHAGFRIVGEACDGREAIRQAGALRPDVILMDIVMSDVDGIEATRTISQRLPGMRIVLLTSSIDEELALLGLRGGAAGHLTKDVAMNELVRAVWRIVAGEPVLSPLVARRLIERLRDPVSLP
jgi:DNA-binding NarL/FixJ family response regulator